MRDGGDEYIGINPQARSNASRSREATKCTYRNQSIRHTHSLGSDKNILEVVINTG